jgi:hypothetical protein
MIFGGKKTIICNRVEYIMIKESKNFMKKYCVGLGVMFCFLLISGCGVKTSYDVVPIEGIATWDGKLIPQEFTIVFRPENGKTESMGFVKDGGRFEAIHTVEIKGVPTGKCTVHIVWGGRDGTTPPKEYEPLIKNYGFQSKGLPLEITKKNKSMKIDFPAVIP